MRTATLVLTLVLSTVQTVGWVECCCVLICKHRNDPCADCKEKQQETPKHEADCCSKKDAPAPPTHQHEKRCSHVEPSSEVLVQDAPSPPVHFDLILELPLVPQAHETSTGHPADYSSAESRGSPPLLHLLYSVLLI